MKNKASVYPAQKGLPLYLYSNVKNTITSMRIASILYSQER